MIPKAPQLLKNTHANLIVQTETSVFGNEGIHRIGLCTEFKQEWSGVSKSLPKEFSNSGGLNTTTR